MRSIQHRAIAVVATFALTLAAGCSNGPEYPNCQNDGECHNGEFCVDGQCQQCRNNDDCPRGRQCNGGRCEPIPGWCDSNADCPDGQECQNNRCVAVQQAEPTPEPTPEPQCQLQEVRFAYNSSDLGAAARSALQANANCIRERNIAHIHLTGHCDPRGTEEYNLALGERRARAAQRYLQNLGVAASRVGVSSMGEEMARGTDESGWAADRRVQFEER